MTDDSADDTSGDDEAAATRRDVDRVIAFSDGVFAIAITLLVLSLEIPDVNDDNLGRALEDVFPQLVAYGLSFAVIGAYWIAHHKMFRTLKRVDSKLLKINLLLLGLVALLPFPTDVLGNHGDTRLAVVLYSVAISAVGFTNTFTFWYINHAGLVARVSADQVRLDLFRASIGPAVFALSIPVALLSATWGKVVWLLIIPANVVLERHYATVGRSGTGEK